MAGPNVFLLRCTFLGLLGISFCKWILRNTFLVFLIVSKLIVYIFLRYYKCKCKNSMNMYSIASLFVLCGRYVKALTSLYGTPVASSYTHVKSLSIILLFCQNQWNIRDMYFCCGLYCASYYNLLPPCTQDNNPSWLIICIPFSLSYCNTLWSVEI